MLYQVGALTFEVLPVNIHETEEEFGGDYAPKDIVGAQRPREFTGPSDEALQFRGRLFPEKFGGLTSLDLLKNMAQGGEPQMVVRGDGRVMGWYLIDKGTVKSSYLDAKGVGRVIEFDVKLWRSPKAGGLAASIVTLGRLLG